MLEGIWLSGFDKHSVLAMVAGQSNTGVVECGGGTREEQEHPWPGNSVVLF